MVESISNGFHNAQCNVVDGHDHWPSERHGLWQIVRGAPTPDFSAVLGGAFGRVVDETRSTTPRGSR